MKVLVCRSLKASFFIYSGFIGFFSCNVHKNDGLMNETEETFRTELGHKKNSREKGQPNLGGLNITFNANSANNVQEPLDSRSSCCCKFKINCGCCCCFFSILILASLGIGAYYAGGALGWWSVVDVDFLKL